MPGRSPTPRLHAHVVATAPVLVHVICALAAPPGMALPATHTPVGYTVCVDTLPDTGQVGAVYALTTRPDDAGE